MGNGADFGEFHLYLFNTCLNKARVARVHSHFKTDRTGLQKLNPEGLNETHQ